MPTQQKPIFAQLFKKYRLKSEFETLAEFGDALAQQGLQYENSIFSHWQKGSRIPRDRNLLLIILKVFVQKGGIASLKEANLLLTAANQGYLSDEELKEFPQLTNMSAPFQAPREIQNFTGRKKYLGIIRGQLQQGAPVLIYGSAGMGKTSAAIKLAHLLREDFVDGVLWQRLDTNKPEEVLSSIAYTFGHNINEMRNVYSKASFVRSLLSGKKILLILDNLEYSFPLELILPNSATNSVLITSRYEELADQFSLHKCPIKQFDGNESFELFTTILGKNFVKKHHKALVDIADLVGHLPLALAVLSKQLKRKKQHPANLLQELKNQQLELDKFTYEDKNLLSSLELVYNKLPPAQQKLFTTLGVFEGTDFSLEAVAYINNLTTSEAKNTLDELISASLVEHSSQDRYRLHPVVRVYAQGKINTLTTYSKAITYYRDLIKKIRLEFNFYTLLEPEINNVTGIFKKCYERNDFSSINIIWRELCHFLWDTGKWLQLEKIAKLTYRLAIKHKDQYTKAMCCVEAFSWLYYWTGQINKAEKYALEALKIAECLKDDYLITYAKQRLGRTLQGKQQFSQSMLYLKESLNYFKKQKDYRRLGNNYRYIAETNSLMGNYPEAKKFLNKALACLNKVKNRYSSIEIYQNLVYTHLGALLLLENNNKHQALHLRESLEIKKKVNTHLGALLFKKNGQQAKLYFKKSLTIDKKIGSKTVGEIWNNVGLGLVYERTGNIHKTLTYFKKAEEASKFFTLGNKIEHRHFFTAILKEELKKSKFYYYIKNIFN